MRPARLRAVLSVCAGILIVIYFWKFTHVSLRTSFSDDDLMNLFFAWRDPVSEIIKANFFIPTNVIRPFGALFYATFYHLFGLDGLPFRVFCYAVLWCNVLLTYVFAWRLTGSREIGLIAVLLHCYQANYFPMYYGSGYCFDVFAFFFYYAAFILVLRQRGCVAIAILFACAVNSKEAAASLPSMLLIYELLYNPPRSRSRGSGVKPDPSWSPAASDAYFSGRDSPARTISSRIPPMPRYSRSKDTCSPPRTI